MASKADAAVRTRTRTVSPVRRAFTLAVQDWWYGLIPFAAINLAWLFLVVTVVAGPPATAAMLGVARDAAVGEGAEPKNFFIYLRQFFWRSWGLGVITFLGSLILFTDLSFYASLNISAIVLFYVFVVWLEFLLLAWPMLVNNPEMPLGQVMRNAAILTLRLPGANLGIALVVLFLAVISTLLAVLLALALAAFVALMAQHYLHIQAPALAGFPPRPGEGAVPPEE